jgi:hypothetical protein
MRKWLDKRTCVHQIFLDFFYFNLLVSFLFLAFSSAVQASAIRLNRQEIIQQSNLIFVGTVLEKNARWNEMGNLIVTDYLFAVDDILWGEVNGNQLTLTFAGGQLAEESQTVSGVSDFEVGELVLLMIEDSDHPLLSPVTGGDQGKFSAGKIDGSGNRVVLDANYQIVKTDNGETICFKDFVEMVKREIAAVKEKPSP